MEKYDDQIGRVHIHARRGLHFSDAFIVGGRGLETRRRRGAMELAGDEDYLLECLDVAIKAGDVPEKRRRKAMDTSAWDLLEKPWKGLLLVALNKEELSNKESSNNRQRRMRGRGRRARNPTTDDWIEEMEGLVSPLHKAPPGYRLSAMLVQRARLGDKWNPTWDTELEKMRNSCAEGIHPVWPRLGREAPLLAEMQSYPEIEVSNMTPTNASEWILSARLDPKNRTALAAWLKTPTPFPLTHPPHPENSLFSAPNHAKSPVSN